MDTLHSQLEGGKEFRGYYLNNNADEVSIIHVLGLRFGENFRYLDTSASVFYSQGEDALKVSGMSQIPLAPWILNRLELLTEEEAKKKLGKLETSAQSPPKSTQAVQSQRRIDWMIPGYSQIDD